MLMLRYVLILAAALLALAQAHPAAACTCIPAQSIATEFAESDAVFVGTVVSHRSALTEMGPGFTVTFQVEESWKGITGGQVEVETGTIYGNCGVPVENGERFIVFAFAGGSGLFMGMCSATTSAPGGIEQVRAAIAATGAQPLTLTPGPDPQYPPPSMVAPCGLGFAGSAIATLVPLVFLRKRIRFGVSRRVGNHRRDAGAAAFFLCALGSSAANPSQ